MVMHWRKQMRAVGRSLKASTSMIVNGTGALATFIVLLVVMATKFAEGAWIILLLVPCMVALFGGIKRHYRYVAEQIASTRPLNVEALQAPVVLVVMRQWSVITEKALRLALEISGNVIAVHINSGDDEGENLKRNWADYVEAPIRAAGATQPRLITVPSPYRRFFHPLLQTVTQIQAEFPERMLAVIVPELVGSRWYDYFLHNQRTTALKAALLLNGGQRVAVINVPWYLPR
jgi:hypothetical protein